MSDRTNALAGTVSAGRTVPAQLEHDHASIRQRSAGDPVPVSQANRVAAGV